MALNRDRLLAAVWRWPVVFLLWLLPSVDDLLKFLGPWRTGVVVVIAALGIAVALLWTVDQGSEPDRWTRSLCMAIGLAVALVFVVGYPLATSGRFGAGTDRADALDVTGAALLIGQPLYATLTYLGNPPTPLPGAVILALPFHLIGSAAFQNLLWIYLLARLAPRLAGDQRGAAAYMAIFVLFCPSVLLDLATGSDFATNAIYVMIAVGLASTVRRDESAWSRALIYLFFALALSSRPIYVVELPIVAGALWREQGHRRSLEFLAATLALCAAINLPIMLGDPGRFPLLLHAKLLRFLPQWMHANFSIPAISLAIAGTAFVVDLGRGRIYLLSAISLAPMLAPTVLHGLMLNGFTGRLAIVGGYALPLALFAGPWLFRLPHRLTPTLAEQNSSLPRAIAPLLQGVSV